MGFLPRLQHLEVLDDGHILKRDVLKWKRENVVEFDRLSFGGKQELCLIDLKQDYFLRLTFDWH